MAASVANRLTLTPARTESMWLRNSRVMLKSGQMTWLLCCLCIQKSDNDSYTVVRTFVASPALVKSTSDQEILDSPAVSQAYVHSALF